jgi:hypothetical protein
MHHDPQLPHGVEPPGPDTSGFKEAVEVLRANLPFGLGTAVECLARAARQTDAALARAELAKAKWHIGKEIAALSPGRAEAGSVEERIDRSRARRGRRRADPRCPDAARPRS